MSPEDAVPSVPTAQTLPSATLHLLLETMTTLSSASTPTSTSLLPSATAGASNSTISTHPGAENGECKLLGPFALFIQGALGLLALLSLVFKRWRERPQRPVKIWAFDASKQVVGSGLLHIANLLMSMVSSGELKPKAEHYQANPCSFYLLNLAIDTTIGIPILIILLRVLTHFFRLTPFARPPESLESGNYGRPPKVTWWLKQCFIYFLGLLGMKCCVFVIFKLCPWIVAVGDWALRWTEGDERVQVFFVMLFFPVVMNALQYYIIDTFIKDQKLGQHEDEDEDGEHDHLQSDDSDGSESDPEGEPVSEAGRGRPKRGRRRHRGDADGSNVGGEDEAVLTKNDVDAHVVEREDKDKDKDKEGTLRTESKNVEEYDPATDGAATGSGKSSNSGAPGPRRDEENHSHSR